MVRRLTTVVALAVLAALLLAVPARADHTTDHTIAQMTAHYQDPTLEFQNKPFALLYLRTTEGMRDANNAGEFSDPTFWDTEVIPTFADYYLDAYAAWQRGDLREVDPAWRIAFRAKPDRLNCTQLIYLGINRPPTGTSSPGGSWRGRPWSPARSEAGNGSPDTRQRLRRRRLLGRLGWSWGGGGGGAGRWRARARPGRPRSRRRCG